LSKGFDIYIDEGLRIRQVFDNIWEFLSDVKEQILKQFPVAEVYLFGSVARGRYTAASDIDVLVVTDVSGWELFDRAKAKLRRMFIDTPVELYIVDRTMFERWYKKRFIGEDELVKI
jgi:predicted nucleotidyltransferase